MSQKIGQIPIIAQKNKTNLGTVIFLHGSGDTGEGIKSWCKSLIGDFSLRHVKFLFPTAPQRPYTPNNGAISNVWFDRSSISPSATEDNATLTSIGEEMKKLIQKEVDTGVPLNKIVVGGYSMGGSLALQTAYRFVPGLAGVFALSAFLNENSGVYDALKRNPSSTPLLMFHGDDDDLVSHEWGKATFNELKKLNVKAEFHTMRNLGHELSTDELTKVLDWIKTVIVET